MKWEVAGGLRKNFPVPFNVLPVGLRSKLACDRLTEEINKV